MGDRSPPIFPPVAGPPDLRVELRPGPGSQRHRVDEQLGGAGRVPGGLVLRSHPARDASRSLHGHDHGLHPQARTDPVTRPKAPPWAHPRRITGTSSAWELLRAHRVLRCRTGSGCGARAARHSAPVPPRSRARSRMVRSGIGPMPWGGEGSLAVEPSGAALPSRGPGSHRELSSARPRYSARADRDHSWQPGRLPGARC